MTVFVKIKSLPASLRDLFNRLFHKRNIIIISERKVKHVPISGSLQFTGVLLALSVVCWASYSTGSYLAARSVLKQQGQMLRSVANAHVDSNFNHDIYPSAKTVSDISATTSASTLATLDNSQLIAQIKLLENTVMELKSTNEAIVQRVQEKTFGRLGELENIIKQTGLNVKELKKEYSESRPEVPHAGKPSAEGGPYIPAATVNLTPQTREMLSELDTLAMLSDIINDLPLAAPIQGAEEQSGFGRRIDPFSQQLAFHSGLDLAGPTGSEIHSTAGGTIVSAGHNGAYGNAVDIDHGHGIVTRYGHLSKILVHEGQVVGKGEIIGVQGSTGRSTGAHLHYEVRYHDQAMNPKRFLSAGQYIFRE